ncbi:MAG TPA: hypothetical protein DEB05_14035 [Firmicutes bacterium]|nr:hypothetical protein [Bacillota bacterium]HBT18061.1 hypothetical protein [Bacillota bacterium]
MKKLGTMLLVVMIIVALFGCGSSNKSGGGVGKLLVMDTRIYGKAYSEYIDSVVVNGNFKNGDPALAESWSQAAMTQQPDGTWKLIFSEMEESQQPVEGASYGFLYYSSETGSNPGWTDMITVTAEQTEFIFDPNDVAVNDQFVNNGTVTVRDKVGAIGTEISLVAGTYSITVTAEIEGSLYVGTQDNIVIRKGKTTVINNLILMPNQTWRFTFDPTLYSLTAGDISTVHLAGEMNGWETNYDISGFQLTKQANDTWVGEFENAAQGQKFNFLVYLTSGGDGIWCPSGMGNNLIVDEATDGVEKVD